MASKTVNIWPVNENGEIVFSSGDGTTNVTGNVPNDFIQIDEVTSKVKAIFDNQMLSAKLANSQLSRALLAPMGGEQAVIANFATYTYMTIAQVDVPYDAVRPVLFNAASNDIPGVSFCVASGPNPSGDKSGNTLTWTRGAFNGAPTATQLAGTAQRPTVLGGDMTPCPSVPRTDGGSGYAVYVRVCIPTGGTLAGSLSSNVDYIQLNSLTKNMMYSNRAPGDFVTTSTAAYPAGGTRGDTTIWGIELLCRGQVVSVIDFGDSITRGQGAVAVKSRNFCQVAADKATMTMQGTAVTNANCGWSSQTSAMYLQRAQDVLAVVKPTLAVYAGFSPNDDPNTGAITPAMIDAERYRLQTFIELCRKNSIVPVTWTGLPASKGWNATSDDRRKAYNVEMKTLYSKTALVADFAKVLSDGKSPAAIIPGYSDGTHPYDNGNELLGTQFITDVLSPVLKTLRT